MRHRKVAHAPGRGEQCQRGKRRVEAHRRLVDQVPAHLMVGSSAEVGAVTEKVCQKNFPASKWF